MRIPKNNIMTNIVNDSFNNKDSYKKPTLCIKSNNKNNKHKELEIPLKNAKTNLQLFNTPESCQGEQHGRRTQI